MTVTRPGRRRGRAGRAAGRGRPPAARRAWPSRRPPRPRPMSAARPPLIRAMNEQFLLSTSATLGPCSRAELARLSGLSKPTVSLALATVERAGLVRVAGQRTGLPGRSALLYEVRPEAGYVLGLDIGHEYVRGALADLAGGVRASSAPRSRATSVRGRVGGADRGWPTGCAATPGSPGRTITQTVIGSPGVYDPRRNSMALTGGLPGWDRPAVAGRAAGGLRPVPGAWRTTWTRRRWPSASTATAGTWTTSPSCTVGTGIGMGLVVGGRLHRGVHGVAGEIAYMPMSGGDGRRRGRRPPPRPAGGGRVRAGRGPRRAPGRHARAGLRAARVRRRGGRRRARRGGRGGRGASWSPGCCAAW